MMKILVQIFYSTNTIEKLTLSLLEGKYAKLTQVDHLWPHKAGDCAYL